LQVKGSRSVFQELDNQNRKEQANGSRGNVDLARIEPFAVALRGVEFPSGGIQDSHDPAVRFAAHGGTSDQGKEKVQAFDCLLEFHRHPPESFIPPVKPDGGILAVPLGEIENPSLEDPTNRLLQGPVLLGKRIGKFTLVLVIPPICTVCQEPSHILSSSLFSAVAEIVL